MSDKDAMTRLLQEYSGYVNAAPPDNKTAAVMAQMVMDGDWTRDGARHVMRLARRYGAFVLANAYALAKAMNVEDGSAGL